MMCNMIYLVINLVWAPVLRTSSEFLAELVDEEAYPVAIR